MFPVKRTRSNMSKLQKRNFVLDIGKKLSSSQNQCPYCLGRKIVEGDFKGQIGQLSSRNII